MSNRNRNAGHQLEREVAKDLRDIGWENTKTCRYVSRILDDAGVDICLASPFNIQCKNSVKLQKYDEIISRIKDMEGIPVLLHRKTVKKKSKFYKDDDYVILRKEDFFEMIEKLKEIGFY